ncbi:hypothetical protein L208DRAFT_1244478, partial [Tricholoma matsutake]
LDKLKSNYRDWSEDITIALSLNGLFEYVMGDMEQPLDTEPQALSNWKANSCLAYTFLASGVAALEHSFLNPLKSAKETWESICKRHQKEGPVRQVTLLQQALTIQCTKETPLMETAEHICMLIE